MLGSLERTSYLTRPRIRVGRLRARIEYTVPECNKNILARSSTTYVLARSTFSRCTRTSTSCKFHPKADPFHASSQVSRSRAGLYRYRYYNLTYNLVLVLVSGNSWLRERAVQSTVLADALYVPEYSPRMLFNRRMLRFTETIESSGIKDGDLVQVLVVSHSPVAPLPPAPRRAAPIAPFGFPSPRPAAHS